MGHNENVLRPGEALSINQYLRSRSGLFFATLQHDANFVVYRGDWVRSPVDTRLWATRQDDAGNQPYAPRGPRPWRLRMQRDGNLVISVAGRNPVWALATHHEGISSVGNVLTLGEDGRLWVAPGGDWSVRRWDSGRTDTLEEDGLLWDKIVLLDPGAANVNVQPLSGPGVTETNRTAVPQSRMMAVPYVDSLTHTYSLATGLPVVMEAFADVELPVVSRNRVAIRVEPTRGWAFGQARSQGGARACAQEVRMGPGVTVEGRATWQLGQVSIVFEGRGTGIFRGLPKVRVPVHVAGVCEASMTFDAVAHMRWSDGALRLVRLDGVPGGVGAEAG